MRALYGEDVQLKLIPTERGFLRRRTGLGLSVASGDYGVSFTQGLAGDLISALEERALWARFGL